jgi:hypothetical protein
MKATSCLALITLLATLAAPSEAQRGGRGGGPPPPAGPVSVKKLYPWDSSTVNVLIVPGRRDGPSTFPLSNYKEEAASLCGARGGQEQQRQ